MDEQLPVEARKTRRIVAGGAIVVAVVTLVLLNLPAERIEIAPPVLQKQATATAYLTNLELLATYASELQERKRGHPKLRRLRLTNFAEMKLSAERLAAASPAIRDDEELWAESQRLAAEHLQKLTTLDYALTASGL